jgi:hypothetical protein
MGAGGQAATDSSPAVLEKGGPFSSDFGDKKLLMLVFCQEGTAEEGNLRLEYIHIAGCADVLRYHIGQPEQIVGDAGANPSPGRFMPPVLDITFPELPTCSPQNLVTGNLGPGVKKGHDILHLIAKAEGAA